eukprot:scaffold31860_cov49-Attheya_sp.AAC.4
MTMRSALLIVATSLVLVASLASAFVTPGGRAISTRRVSLWAEEAEVADDPFQNYKIGDPLQGLAINDAEVGEGDMAALGNVITVTYKGRLLADGKIFDQGDGFSLKLGAGKAIQGWEQGLLGVRSGGKRILRIPPKLAYGEKGAGNGVIPPNADLEFDIRFEPSYWFSRTPGHFNSPTPVRNWRKGFHLKKNRKGRLRTDRT